MSRFSFLSRNLCLQTILISSTLTGTSLVSTAKTTPELIQAQPQAIQQNLYASALGSVGDNLSPELQGKPVVIDIYATWCSACKNIAPTLSELKQEYAEEVHFVVFDVTDKSAAKQSEARAKELGLADFFTAHKSKTGTVVIVDPATGDILAMEKNNTDKATYTSILDAQIAKK